MARTVKPKSGVSQKVVSLKVTLRDTKPPVWRRLLVPGETTLADLHRAIQAAMGWEDYHLHTFDIAGRQYGDPRAVDDVADETRVTPNGLIKSGVTPHPSPQCSADGVGLKRSAFATAWAKFCISGVRRGSGMFGIRS